MGAIFDAIFNCLTLIFNDSANAAVYCAYQLVEFPHWLEGLSLVAFLLGLAFLSWARWLGKKEEENARKTKRKTGKSRGSL